MAVKCILTGQTPSVLDGVTENVQTQLNNKVDKITGKGLSTQDYTSAEKTKLSGIEEGAQKNTVTGIKGSAETVYRTGNVNITATNIGLGNVNNTSDTDKPISAATQTALNGKQAKVTGAATTITGDNLTANRALVSNSSGKVAVSAVTATELGYLDGVTGNIQTQLNGKLSSAPVTSVNNKTGAVSLAASDVGALPISGGTLTGNLNGKYITGTWLQTTEVSDKAGDFATIDSDGWIYKRTASEVNEDIITGHSIKPTYIELFPGNTAGHGGYIDFHYDSNIADYTSRIIEIPSGHVQLNGMDIVTRENIIVVWNVGITFTNGIAEYSNNAIKANNPCFVQFRASSVNSTFQNTALAVHNQTNGKLTIVAKNGATFSSHLNILIFKF